MDIKQHSKHQWLASHGLEGSYNHTLTKWDENKELKTEEKKQNTFILCVSQGIEVHIIPIDCPLLFLPL